jgi:hypothetical protein
MATDYPDALAPNSRAIFAELCSSLPKRAAETEEAIAARARKALDAVSALHPEDQFEADLATSIVAMRAHAMDALCAAAQAADDPDRVRQCRAQAASMARQSDAALRTLRRIQAERDKAFNEMHPATMSRAGYWFREVSEPAAGTGPVHDRGPQTPPRPTAQPATAVEPERTPADIETDAKLYAAMYPDRVRRIRAASGLPPDLDFGPPEPEIVDAVLRGASGVYAVPPHATHSNATGH